jgi:hypothetical protein
VLFSCTPAPLDWAIFHTCQEEARKEPEGVEGTVGNGPLPSKSRCRKLIVRPSYCVVQIFNALRVRICGQN